VVGVIWLAVVGLVCGLIGMGTGVWLVRRRGANAWIYVVMGLPGVLGGVYHIWRLWP
jgi:uncharacterized membrane protein YfcA